MSIQVLNKYRGYSDWQFRGGNAKASDAAWNDLYVRLSQEPLLAGYNVIFNENGQIIDRSAADLATLIAHAPVPTVWIDYCGWPMAYQPFWWTANLLVDIELTRFAQFVRALDTRLVAQSLPHPNFIGVHATGELAFDSPGGSYLMPNGLSVNVDLQNAPWRDDGRADGGGYWIDSRYAVMGERWQGYDQYTYGMFGIRRGRNWYFWAYGNSDTSTLSVPTMDYAGFVHWAMWQAAGGAGPIQGPPLPPGWEPPTENPGQPPPGTGAPGQGGDTGTLPGKVANWWSGLPPTHQAAIVAGGLALLIGTAAVLNRRPARPEG